MECMAGYTVYIYTTKAIFSLKHCMYMLYIYIASYSCLTCNLFHKYILIIWEFTVFLGTHIGHELIPMAEHVLYYICVLMRPPLCIVHGHEKQFISAACISLLLHHRSIGLHLREEGSGRPSGHKWHDRY